MDCSFKHGQTRVCGHGAFADLFGRINFPQSDHDTLIASVKIRPCPTGDDTVFIPGHDPESTFGRERQSNPYVEGRFFC
jgi:glyoxylase-like metal-dependent hydrolase (beta-lactamase superfamily II)